jgi:hypothetical protein
MYMLIKEELNKYLAKALWPKAQGLGGVESFFMGHAP